MPAGEAPLAGRGVLVTRPKDQAAALTGQLEALGAVVHALPTIEIRRIDGAQRDARLTAAHDWIVLTSANAARMWVEALGGAGVAAGTRIAAIGPSTAKVLEAAGLAVDLVPPVYRAEALLEALVAAGVAGKRVLVPRALRARDVLPDGLAGVAQLDVVPIYETRVAAGASERLAELLGAGAIDAVTFLSSSAVESFHELLGAPPRGGVVFAAIGPVTADTARALGLAPVVVAREATVAGLIEALVQHYRNV